MGRRTVLLVLLLGVWGISQAVEVKIIDADKLELRPITVPGGKETELIVITGSPVRLEVDGDRIIAEYVEFDRDSRVLRIVGSGNVSYDNVTTKGQDYLLDLGNGDLTFQDVFIFTQPLDIEGVSATRQPGEIDISSAQFSPCSRCESEVQDYRFSAERLNFYPGDRLVAFNVTVYLRNLPSFFLPLMVVPLGPEDRRPRFSLERGTSTERAEVALDWPYFFGANQFGTSSLRYYADVTPGLSNSPLETIFGGTITQSYFGGGFDHRFFTGRGRGTVQFFYTPSFLLTPRSGDPEEDADLSTETTPEEFKYTLGYKTEEALGGFQTDLLLESDDAANPRIINLTTRLGTAYGGFDFAYVTQTYFDLDPTDTSYSPSYDENEGALRTYGQLAVSKSEDLTFSVGPFSLTNFLVSAGVYEDYANPANGSAQQFGLTLGNGSLLVRGGRLLERHTITLDTLSPFSGSSITGSTTYTGQIYSTTNSNGEFERLVDWTTTLSADQTFNGGSFGVDFSRVILDGETPFSFDARTTPNSRTELSGEFALTPAPWFDLSVSNGYVFQDDRSFSNSEEEGWEPLETRLELFNDLDWVGITVEEAYDIGENDLGLLGATLALNSPSTVWTSSLAVSGIYDLNQTVDPLSGSGPVVNESEVDVETRFGYTAYATLGLEAGYDYNGRREPAFGDDVFDPDNEGAFNGGYSEGGTLEPGTESQGVALYKPFVFSLTAGTESQEDYVPSLTLSFDRDVNIGRMNSAGYELNARVGPLELSARQAFDFDSQDASNTLFSVTYPDVIELSASGFTPLAPETIGLDRDPEDSVTYQLNLLDQTQEGDPKLYEVTYETTYGPLFSGTGETDLGFSDTNLTGRINLETAFVGTALGPLGFGLDFDATLQLPDDAQPLTYLSSGSAQLTADFFSTVGLQGTLSYSAISDGDPEFPELIEQQLTFTDFGPTVRLFGDLYLSALLGSENTDVWDFVDPVDDTVPYNLQPTIYLTLDRCCWAFYGAYNTKNGKISLSLGYPGSDQGLTGTFDTGLALPGRENR